MTARRIFAACLFVCFSGSAHAVDTFAPYLESTTMLLARIDVQRTNPEELFRYLQTHFPDSQSPQVLPVRAFAGAYILTLRDAKVKNIYITLSTVDCLTGSFAVLIPCPEPEKVFSVLETLVPQIPAQMKMGIHRSTGMIALASPQVWKRLSAQPSATRPDLLAGDATAETTWAALTISLPERLRMEVADIWPEKMPSQVPFESSPKSLMADIRSLTLSVSPLSEPSIRVRAVTTDAVAAGRVQAPLAKAVSLIPDVKLRVVASQSDVTVTISTAEISQFLSRLVKPVRAAGQQSQDSNSLKSIMLAMHGFHEKHQYLPPRETRTAEGKPLLSWRVFLLPYLGQEALYKEFRLNEPWDSPHNRPLADKMPAVYRTATFDLSAGYTCFQLPILPGGTWFGDGPPKRLQDVTDGTSNTVAVVVAQREKAVIWTKPQELSLRPETLAADFFAERESLPIAYFDGSIRSQKSDITSESLRALITSAGGEVIEAR